MCNSGSGDVCDSPYKESLQFKNLGLDTISAYIDLQQVGNLQNNVLYIHQENREQNAITTQLQLQAANSNLTVANASLQTPGIPPSSLMTFLLAKPDIQGVVLTEHSAQYTNPY